MRAEPETGDDDNRRKNDLIELIEKGADADLVRELLALAAERMMEVEAKTGAGLGARSSARCTHRNGYRERGWETRAGRIDLAIPKLRKGSYFPSFLEPRRTAEKALTAVIQEAYVHGISTRGGRPRQSDGRLGRVQEPGLAPVRGDRRAGERVSLPPHRGRLALSDATYLKVREAGRIVSVAVIIAVGVNTDGRREVLGVGHRRLGGGALLESLPRSLADRGLRGVRLVVADDHKGLRAAAAKVFSATHQRCRVHWMRNALAHVPPKQRPAAVAMLKTIFAQDSAQAAHAQWRQVAEALRERFPKLAELMDAARADVLAYMTFPREHWPQIASTNPLERLNGEIKRRADVIGIFPNDRAVVRRVGALMLEQNDEGAVSRRDMSLESLASSSDDPTLRLSAVAA